MKSAIYGGSFDPVHVGHVQAVARALEKVDSVIVMPAHVSPFKDRTAAADADRLTMLRAAFEPFGARVSVDTYELDRGGISYTIDTLEAYRDRNPILMVGGDSFKTLSTWRRADDIRARYPILVVPRRGIDCAAETDDWIARGGRCTMTEAVAEVSSTVIRLQVALDSAPIDVPDAVADYIRAHGLYRGYEDIRALWMQFGLKKSRIEHTKGVAVTACRLALRHGADVAVTVRAALLHDIAKYVDVSEAESLGIRLSREIVETEDAIKHAFIGAEIASQLLGERQEIVEAIRWHTTGRVGMTKCEAIVCLADYVEPSRHFPGVTAVRAAAETSLGAAVKLMLTQTVEHLHKKGSAIHPATLQALADVEKRKDL